MTLKNSAWAGERVLLLPSLETDEALITEAVARNPDLVSAEQYFSYLPSSLEDDSLFVARLTEILRATQPSEIYRLERTELFRNLKWSKTKQLVLRDALGKILERKSTNLVANDLCLLNSILLGRPTEICEKTKFVQLQDRIVVFGGLLSEIPVGFEQDYWITILSNKLQPTTLLGSLSPRLIEESRSMTPFWRGDCTKPLLLWNNEKNVKLQFMHGKLCTAGSVSETSESSRTLGLRPENRNWLVLGGLSIIAFGLASSRYNIRPIWQKQ